MPNNSDPELIAKFAAMAGAFTPEKYAYLLTLLPNPGRVAELNTQLGANYPDALKGDPEKLKEFQATREAVNMELSLVSGLAKLAALKDPTVPKTLGLGPVAEKAAAATPTLSIPQGYKLVFDQKGQLFASVAKVQGAKGYQVWACDDDPSVEGNWRLLTASPSCKAIPITGLNRTKFNVLKIRAMRGHTAGPWSNWVSLDPI